MRETCGCTGMPGNQHLIAPTGTPHRSSDGKASVEVPTGRLHENDRQAMHDRERFRCHDVLVINLMSSPGSGKTSLPEATIQAIDSGIRIGVIEGDLKTENDVYRRQTHAPNAGPK